MSALALKLVACFCMLLDHIGYCIPKLLPLRVIGRLAFPLYVFLLTEGFRHSSSRLRYGLRLLLFTLISQPAFALFSAKDLYYPVGSVMFTLLAAFVSLWLIESCRSNLVLRLISWAAVAGLCLLFHLEYLDSDYGAQGILLALCYYYVKPKQIPTERGEWTRCLLALMFCTFLCMFYEPILRNGKQMISYILGRSEGFYPLKAWTRVKGFALLAVPLMMRYNGTRGWTPASRAGRKALQYGFYLFYPVHMMILYWTIR